MEAYNKLSSKFENEKIYNMIVSCLQSEPDERTETTALVQNEAFQGRFWEANYSQVLKKTKRLSEINCDRDTPFSHANNVSKEFTLDWTYKWTSFITYKSTLKHL